MTDKYVLLIPKGGLNDQFTQIQIVINYCISKNRTLLLHTQYPSNCYRINFSDYFDIENNECNIIYDSNKIKDIFNNNTLTAYPNILSNKLSLIFGENNEFKFSWKFNDGNYKCNGINLVLPDNYIDEDCIVYVNHGGNHNGFKFLKQISIKENIKNICKERLDIIGDNYLCIQVRDTDHKCDYIRLYEENKEEIESYEKIYVATDSKECLKFFKSKNLNIYNFVTFPKGEYHNLHYCNISPDIKIKDVFTDIFIATNSCKIISNSNGYFINLLRNCHENKTLILSKLK